MGRVIYGHYSDNVAPSATVTVSTGTGDADYPPQNLVDLVPAKPGQLTTTSGAWLFSYSTAQRIDLIALPHHNLAAGLAVYVQGNASDSWGAPSFNQLITIPAYRKDALPPGAFLDLTSLAGYSAGGFQYWRLAVTGVNSAPVKVGEVVLLSQIRTLNPNISWGAKPTEERLIIENKTDYGVSSIYDMGITIRRLTGELDTTDAGRQAVADWWQDCRGRARAFLLIPDEDVNDAWMARWDVKFDPTLVLTDRNTFQLAFEEVSRGLYL